MVSGGGASCPLYDVKLTMSTQPKEKKESSWWPVIIFFAVLLVVGGYGMYESWKTYRTNGLVAEYVCLLAEEDPTYSETLVALRGTCKEHK